MAPVVIDSMMIINMKESIVKEYEIRDSGAIFWIVIKMKQLFHSNPSITLGNHQWKGEAPLFISNGADRIIFVKWVLFREKRFSRNPFIKMRNNNLTEANAWIRKYLRDASVVKILFLFDIIGINDNKLTSRPIQAPNQELEETVINTPSKSIKRKRIFGELLGIREESFMLYRWGMSPLALFSLLF